MKNPQKKCQTAAEFLKECEADPAYREMRERQERLGVSLTNGCEFPRPLLLRICTRSA